MKLWGKRKTFKQDTAAQQDCVLRFLNLLKRPSNSEKNLFHVTSILGGRLEVHKALRPGFSNSMLYTELSFNIFKTLSWLCSKETWLRERKNIAQKSLPDKKLNFQLSPNWHSSSTGLLCIKTYHTFSCYLVLPTEVKVQLHCKPNASKNPFIWLS